jgi:hypothetical protein
MPSTCNPIHAGAMCCAKRHQLEFHFPGADGAYMLGTTSTTFSISFLKHFSPISSSTQEELNVIRHIILTSSCTLTCKYIAEVLRGVPENLLAKRRNCCVPRPCSRDKLVVNALKFIEYASSACDHELAVSIVVNAAVLFIRPSDQALVRAPGDYHGISNSSEYTRVACIELGSTHQRFQVGICCQPVCIGFDMNRRAQIDLRHGQLQVLV